MPVTFVYMPDGTGVTDLLAACRECTHQQQCPPGGHASWQRLGCCTWTPDLPTSSCLPQPVQDQVAQHLRQGQTSYWLHSKAELTGANMVTCGLLLPSRPCSPAACRRQLGCQPAGSEADTRQPWQHCLSADMGTMQSQPSCKQARKPRSSGDA